MPRCILFNFLVISAIFCGYFAFGNIMGNKTHYLKEATKSKLSFFLRSSNLECYECIGCLETAVPRTKSCKQLLPHSYLSNVCVIFAEKHRYIPGEDISFVIKGCATERGSCDEIRKNYSEDQSNPVQFEYCYECEGNKCNSGSNIDSNSGSNIGSNSDNNSDSIGDNYSDSKSDSNSVSRSLPDVIIGFFTVFLSPILIRYTCS